MIRFIKQYWILILISLVAVLFTVNKILITKQPIPPAPISSTTDIASYRSLLPGSSTEDQVNELLGLPLKEQVSGSKKIAEYVSTNQYRNHTVAFENEKVSLIKEVVNTPDNKSSDSITSIYGLAPYIFYDQNPASTFQLYVYPENGIAYLGHEDKTLLEIWYFEPMTIDQFISKWGEGYSKEKSKIIPEGY